MKSGLILNIVGAFTVIAAGYFIVSYVTMPSVEVVMSAEAKELNRLCPVEMSDGITLDSVSVIFYPKRTFVMYCKLTDTDVDSVNRTAVSNYYKPRLVEDVRSDESGFEYLKSRNVNINYVCVDKNDKPVFSLTVKPGDYK